MKERTVLYESQDVVVLGVGNIPQGGAVGFTQGELACIMQCTASIYDAAVDSGVLPSVLYNACLNVLGRMLGELPSDVRTQTLGSTVEALYAIVDKGAGEKA